MPRRINTGNITPNEQMDLMSQAMSGDMVISIDPETVDRVATAAAWTRTVIVRVTNAAGQVHAWLNDAYATSAAIADDSTAGTASIPSTTLTVVNGIASVVVSGTAAAWIANETNTLTISNLTIMGYTVTGGTSVETIVAE